MASMGEFREYTPIALSKALADGVGDAIEITVQDTAGRTILNGLVLLSVTTGTDYDRSGGYAWTRIVAKLEIVADQHRVMRAIRADELAIGSQQPVWSEGGGLFRTLTDRGTNPTADGDVLLYFDNDPVPEVYPPHMPLIVFPPSRGRL